MKDNYLKKMRRDLKKTEQTIEEAAENVSKSLTCKYETITELFKTFYKFIGKKKEN